MTKNAIAILILLIASGCRSITEIPVGMTAPVSAINEISKGEPLAILSLIGGLCLCAGMVLLVLSRGARGWYPVIGGFILVILNYLVSRYDDYLFFPVLVFTGLISAAWTYKTVKQILMEKKS